MVKAEVGETDKGRMARGKPFAVLRVGGVLKSFWLGSGSIRAVDPRICSGPSTQEEAGGPDAGASDPPFGQ